MTSGSYGLNMYVFPDLVLIFLSAPVVCLSALAQGHSFLEIAAIVNGTVTLPCNCSGQEVKWNLIHHISESIAVCHQGNCQIEQDLRKRFSIVGNTSAGNFSISINSTFYNDAGFYTCTCKEESASNVKLKVYGKRT